MLGISLIPPARVLRTLRLVRNTYERILWSEAAGAQAYLRSRGITAAVAARFHLGAAPAAGSLIRHLHRYRIKAWDLEAAGLVRRFGDRYIEILRSRVVFPLSGPTGRTLGFAGRALVAGPPKYMNTKVSAVGSSRDTLFGLPQAVGSIGRRGLAWIVEGYLDVLACHQVGLTWVVGVGGIRPTTQQALQLRRLVNRVVLILDGGTEAPMISRAAAPLQQVGLEVMAASLPPAIDPDVLVFQEGPSTLERIVARARPC